MNNFFWICSQKGNRIPVINGYKFRYKGKGTGFTTYWKCLSANCTARATFSNYDLVRTSGMHTHSTDFNAVLKSQFKSVIFDILVHSPFVSSNELYNRVIRILQDNYGVDGGDLSQVVSFDSLKPSIYRWKAIFLPFTGIFNSVNFDVSEFNLPNGNSFPLYRELDGEKMLITCDVNYLQRFLRARNYKVYMDGTFKSASNRFYQVYIIHGEFGGQSFPLIYCFLLNKTEETYIKVFNSIKSTLAIKSIDFSPVVMQIDFEVAAYNAIRHCFPHSRITGCFFHFGQSIWRRVQKLDLVTLYNENGHFAELIETITTIALILG